MSNDNEYRMELCGPCIHSYDNSLTYKVTELGPRKKCTCSQCGKWGYGAFCLIQQTTGRQERIEPHDSHSRMAR